MADMEADDSEKSQKNVENKDSDVIAGKISQQANQDDLDELLDSALADFNKTSPPPGRKSTQDKTKAKSKKTAKNKCEEAVLNEVFNEAEMANAAQEAMRALSTEEPALFEQFQKFMANSQGDQTLGEEEKFMNSLKETMRSMTDNANDIETEELDDDDLVKSLKDLGIDISDADDENFDPLIENMMKNLLSKDVLYPSLQKMNEVYPAWLTEHKSSLSPDQFGIYQKQYQLIDEICQEFEAEDELDEEGVRKARFDRVYALMQEMQECGHPPPDIVKEMASGMSLDSRGLPCIPGMEAQCSLM